MMQMLDYFYLSLSPSLSLDCMRDGERETDL